jgi:hypothetical protein
MTRLSPATLVILLALGPAVAGAQPPLPGTGSGQAMPMGVPEAAPPDTVVARLDLAEGQPLPKSAAFLADTITVGRDAWLRLEYAGDAVLAGREEFREVGDFDQDWIGWAPGGKARPAGENAVELPVKVYQINPFRVEVGDRSTGVVLVDFRTTGLQETAAIREPRRWGWNLMTLVLGVLLITALVLLGWWAWTARKVVTEQLPDWEVPPPAWLQTAADLQQLQDDRLAESGQERLFLDRLAGICRRYLAGRYRVGATEMTGQEILAACRERGHDPRMVARFTSLLDRIDSCRYDPDGPSAEDCRLRSSEFLTAVAQVRVMPRFTPVPAALARAGQSAWNSLGRLLAADEEPSLADPAASGKGGE